MLRLLSAAVACVTCSMAAQAGLVFASPFTFTPPSLAIGGDWAFPTASNPNKIVGTSTWGGPPFPVTASITTVHTTPFPVSLANLETEYDFEWTINNSFSTSIIGMSFTFSGFSALRFDGGPTGTLLSSVPTSSLGTLMSWTPSKIDFNFSGSGLANGQSATFHLPLDVLSAAAAFAFQNVVGTPRLAPIPEPGTVLMFGTSLLALAVPWRRRRVSPLP